MPRRTAKRLRAAIAAGFVLFAIVAAGCIATSIPHAGTPASGYEAGDPAPLVVQVTDETGGSDWSPAIATALARYADGAPRLVFAASPDANIRIVVRRYVDADPPVLRGYNFEPGVGGFAAVYDADGKACNFPPSHLPVNCSGEIASAEIYVNDAIPPGWDIEERRLRLILHELGHALGLARHSPDLGVEQLAARYGW